MSERNCFNCGKPGHFKSQCRSPGGGSAPKGRGPPPSSVKPKTVCPRCRKGFHWASQCLLVILNLLPAPTIPQFLL
uniref:CCHC-type domain-containing protein n=1 Tax=Pseudonaja textilis TaxID=8673 RepID=A0A670XZ21_PSETE